MRRLIRDHLVWIWIGISSFCHLRSTFCFDMLLLWKHIGILVLILRWIHEWRVYIVLRGGSNDLLRRIFAYNNIFTLCTIWAHYVTIIKLFDCSSHPILTYGSNIDNILNSLRLHFEISSLIREELCLSIIHVYHLMCLQLRHICLAFSQISLWPLPPNLFPILINQKENETYSACSDFCVELLFCALF